MNATATHGAFNVQNATLIELEPDHTQYLEQVAGNDRVHKFGAQSVPDLLEYRIGGKDYAKTAFALVSAATSRLHSVIFGFKALGPVASTADIPGRVDEILHLPSRSPISGVPSAMVFYSISAFDSGAGPALVRSLLAQNPDYLPATLSPLRTLRPAHPDMRAHLLSETGKKMLAAMHLMTLNDPVQRFHMGNGAIIGDIKIKANTPDSEDGRDGLGIMVNYIYPRDAQQRADNQALFRAIIDGRADSGHLLRDLMDPSLRASLYGHHSVAVTAALCARLGREAADRLVHS